MAVTRSNRRKRPTRAEVKPGECLCDFCTGVCCRYFSLPIHNPTTWNDYDTIRWFLAHAKTIIYVEKEQWYILVNTTCQYLRPDNRCGIYLNRPQICREYTTDSCEYDNRWSFEKIFETPEQIWEYAEAILPRRRKIRGPSTFQLPIVTINGVATKAAGTAQPDRSTD